MVDKDYKILALLRSYQVGSEDAVTVGNYYPRDIRQKLELMTTESLNAILKEEKNAGKSMKNSLSLAIRMLFHFAYRHFLGSSMKRMAVN